jgi:alpha-tubulin suppressor-like RCC1 family protein
MSAVGKSDARSPAVQAVRARSSPGMRLLRRIVVLALALQMGACSPVPARSVVDPPPSTPAMHATNTETCVRGPDGDAYCWGYILLSSPEGIVHRVRDSAGRAARFVSLDAGWWQECGLDRDGHAACTRAMAGHGNDTSMVRGPCITALCVYPVAMPAGQRVALVSSGYLHACALTTEGVAYCWGYNKMGELGLGWRSSDSTTPGLEHVWLPTPVAGGHRFRQLSAGDNHTCAIDLSGAAYCWGYGQQGELGLDTVMSYCNGPQPDWTAPCSVDRPVPVDTRLRFRQINAGNGLTCAVSTDSAAYCWGDNYTCALGRCDGRDSPRPTRIALPRPVVQVSAGYWFACAITDDRRAYCWGYNADGQLGSAASGNWRQCLGGERCSQVPVEVAGGHRWLVVATGERHACGVAKDGAVYCWGHAEHGLLGMDPGKAICHHRNGSPPDELCSEVPVRVTGVPLLVVAH